MASKISVDYEPRWLERTTLNMEPHLLTLPAEIRYRILKFATQHDEILGCNPETCEQDYFDGTSKHIPNPNTALWLICKQISAELPLIGQTKAALRCCKLTCARLLFYAQASLLWSRRIECFRIFCEREDLRRLQGGHDFCTFLDRVATLLFGSKATYSLEGGFEDKKGVDVSFYPRRNDLA